MIFKTNIQFLSILQIFHILTSLSLFLFGNIADCYLSAKFIALLSVGIFSVAENVSAHAEFPGACALPGSGAVGSAARKRRL